MKIIIQNQGVLEADVKESMKSGGFKSPEVALDSTAYDVPGWVSIEIGGVSVAEVHITDLYPAVIGFKTEYDLRKNI